MLDNNNDERLTLTTEELSSYSLRLPRVYDWEPQKDITTYELTLCVPILIMASTSAWIDIETQVESLPEEAKRHFKEHNK